MVPTGKCVLPSNVTKKTLDIIAIFVITNRCYNKHMQKFVLYTKTQADKVNDRKLGQEDAEKIIRH